MPVGRYFQGLTAYDLLGNLVPGVVGLIAIIGFLPNPPIPKTIGGHALFSIFAFSFGTLIQAHASSAVGTRKHFDYTMDSAESLNSLSNSDNLDSREISILQRVVALIVDLCHSIFGPILWWARSERGTRLDDIILVNRIWRHLRDTHELPKDTEHYNVVYHIMSSKVEDISSPSRAIRMQALRNFHRGMWIATWYMLILVSIAFLLSELFSVGGTVVGGLQYFEPTYFDYWGELWHLIVLLSILTVAFWFQAESVEEDYIEYLFADYAVSIAKNNSEIGLSEGSELGLAGNIGGSIGISDEVEIVMSEKREGGGESNKQS